MTLLSPEQHCLRSLLYLTPQQYCGCASDVLWHPATITHLVPCAAACYEYYLRQLLLPVCSSVAWIPEAVSVMRPTAQSLTGIHMPAQRW